MACIEAIGEQVCVDQVLSTPWLLFRQNSVVDHRQRPPVLVVFRRSHSSGEQRLSQGERDRPHGEGESWHFSENGCSFLVFVGDVVSLGDLGESAGVHCDKIGRTSSGRLLHVCKARVGCHEWCLFVGGVVWGRRCSMAGNTSSSHPVYDFRNVSPQCLAIPVGTTTSCCYVGSSRDGSSSCVVCLCFVLFVASNV